MTRFAFAAPSAMVRVSRSVVASHLLLLAAALAAGPAHAAEKARKDAPVKSSDSVLTPTQLRACLAQQDEIKSRTDDALKDKAAIAQDRAEIARVDAELGAELSAIDQTSQEAVDAYNTKVRAQDQRAKALEAKVEAFNRKADGLQSSKETFQQACGNRRYDERDLDDLKRRKK
jgi:uncharacterized protein involved in exopolysaccharide biosynthesis